MASKSNLQYDLTKLKPGETVLARFPELAVYPAFSEFGTGEGDALLRFVTYYCDKGSEYRDLPLDLKKQECLERAGIKATDPRRPDILAWKNVAVVKMANQYVRLLNDLDYATWFHSLLGLYDSLEQVSKHIDAKELEADKEGRAFILRHELIAKINVQRKDVKELGNSLFLSDEQLRKVSQDAALNETGSVEKRAAGQSFVPQQKKQ